MFTILPIISGWLADRIFGDPERLPHLIVWFGRVIAAGERKLNVGKNRMAKGGLLAITLVCLAFASTYYILSLAGHLSPWLRCVIEAVLIFYCLAGKTLTTEVLNVFKALETSLEQGRRQVARIVGRDTSALTDDEVKKAALETLAENLSDGVIAPMFWLLLLGVPGMVAYKMINTLDSMIGYRTERYVKFGTFAARIDDVANYVPARLTSLLMIASSGRLSLIGFVASHGKRHTSPNSGYPEAALAGILNCRFGGGHYYFGEYMEKPFIGENDRLLASSDVHKAVRICRTAELIMLSLLLAVGILNCYRL